jgi:type I restriction enzyme, S subunit
MKVEQVPFTELLSNIVDNRGRTCPTADSGLPLIATNCVKTDRLYPAFEKVRYVSEDTYRHWFRGHPEPGDILFVCKGSPGRVAMTPDPVSFCVAQDMVAVRADAGRVYPRYLFAALRSSIVQAQISNMHVGTLIPHFKKGDFSSLRIPVVAADQQRFIGDIYFNLSNKIESNRRLTVLIPWLMAACVARALLERSELVSVATLAKFVNGGAFTKGATGRGRMVLRIAELNSGPGPSTVYNDLNVPDEKLARPGDILMSWSGSLDVYRWARDEAIINQHIFKVIPKSLPVWLVHDRLTSVMPLFQAIAKDKTTTMGHIQRGHLESTEVAIPSADAIKDLNTTFTPLWDRLLRAERETVKIGALRDELLPELLSGRIRGVPSDEAVEAAA